jgi:hypothetical protein
MEAVRPQITAVLPTCGKEWRDEQDETANWSILIPSETYNGPTPSARILPVWEVLETANRPLSTAEIVDRVLAKHPDGLNRDLVRQAIYYMHRCGWLFAYAFDLERRWQLGVCRRTWRAELRLTFQPSDE